MVDNKGFGKILLIMGFALLLVGIGIGIYSEMFGSWRATVLNSIPVWLANMIAVTFSIFGIVVIVLGANELGLIRKWIRKWLS